MLWPGGCSGSRSCTTSSTRSSAGCFRASNTLGIAATGAGKTECFLLPALLLPGLTVVVSPLKSLMQDQWERCDERYGLGALTTYINGDVDYRRAHSPPASDASRPLQARLLYPRTARAATTSGPCYSKPRSACWRSMRLIASANGATISVRITSTWSGACGAAGIRRR